MPSDAHLRTCTIGHGAVTIVTESLCEVAEMGSAANSSMPSGLVHRKLLEVFQIDNDGVVFPSNTIVPMSGHRSALVRSICYGGSGLRVGNGKPNSHFNYFYTSYS